MCYIVKILRWIEEDHIASIWLKVVGDTFCAVFKNRVSKKTSLKFLHTFTDARSHIIDSYH